MHHAFEPFPEVLAPITPLHFPLPLPLIPLELAPVLAPIPVFQVALPHPFVCPEVPRVSDPFGGV